MLTLHDIMSIEVKSLAPDMTLRDVMEFLTSEHIGGAPVVSGERVVGVLSVTDLLDFVSTTPGPPTTGNEGADWLEPSPEDTWSGAEEPGAAYFGDYWADVGVQVDERFRATTSPEWDVFEEHVVSELMTRRLCELPPETGLQEAAELMLKSGIHRVLVTEDDRLIGVASTTDIVKAVAQYGVGG